MVLVVVVVVVAAVLVVASLLVPSHWAQYYLMWRTHTRQTRAKCFHVRVLVRASLFACVRKHKRQSEQLTRTTATPPPPPPPLLPRTLEQQRMLWVVARGLFVRERIIFGSCLSSYAMKDDFGAVFVELS